MVIKVTKRFFNQNHTSFHCHYHCLLPPTKRTVKVRSKDIHDQSPDFSPKGVSQEEPLVRSCCLARPMDELQDPSIKIIQNQINMAHTYFICNTINIAKFLIPKDGGRLNETIDQKFICNSFTKFATLLGCFFLHRYFCKSK